LVSFEERADFALKYILVLNSQYFLTLV
jgi:hypothetical protein